MKSGAHYLSIPLLYLSLKYSTSTSLRLKKKNRAAAATVQHLSYTLVKKFYFSEFDVRSYRLATLSTFA